MNLIGPPMLAHPLAAFSHYQAPLAFRMPTCGLLEHHTFIADGQSPFIKFLEELQGAANHCITLIDYQVSHSKEFDMPNKHEKELLQIKHFAQEWVFDGTGKAQNSAARSQGGKQPLFHFLRMNPVYCGLLTFRLNMLRRDAGQTLANTSGSAITAMHLYNACRQGCGLNRRWEDAEFLYQIHTTERLFVGAPPKDPQDYRKRLLLMVGASVTNFARNRREGGRHSFVGSKRGRRGFPAESPVTKAFRSRYIQDGNAVLSKSNMLDLALSARRSQRMLRTCSRSLRAVENLAGRVAASQHLTPVQLLECVREGVAAEEMHLLFDYFGFHNCASGLLAVVSKEVDDDLNNYFDCKCVIGNSDLPLVPGYILEMVAEADQTFGQLRFSRTSSKVLQKASVAILEFLGREQNTMGSLAVIRARYTTRACSHARLNRDMDELGILNPHAKQQR